MRGDHKLSVSSLVFSFLAITLLSFQSLWFAETKASFVELPPMSLTIVGTDGTQVVLDEVDIGDMDSWRDYGGYKTSFPSLKGRGYYTGVPINALCDLVGGIHYGQTLRVTASDDYNISFTYEQVNGDFVTYDNVTGDQVPHDQPLTTILAYYFNDTNLTSGGPLRFAIVGPEGLCTDSAYWVQHVVKMEIFGEGIPEFPSPIMLSLPLFVTLAVAFGFKVFKRRQLCAKRSCGLTGEHGYGE
jgi:hypothetical protein